MFEVKVKEESLKVAHGMVTLDTCEQIGIKLGTGKKEVCFLGFDIPTSSFILLEMFFYYFILYIVYTSCD